MFQKKRGRCLAVGLYVKWCYRVRVCACCVDCFVAYHNIDAKVGVTEHTAFQHFYRNVLSWARKCAIEQCSAAEDLVAYAPVFGKQNPNLTRASV
jgi:hypothetical protein